MSDQKLHYRKKTIDFHSNISLEDIKNAEKVLTDNGIPADEASTVLQAIGYALLDLELYNEPNDEHSTIGLEYKRLGYYNGAGDIRELAGKSADEILEYYKKGFGAFHSDNNSDYSLTEREETESGATERGSTRFTADKHFAVTDSTLEETTVKELESSDDSKDTDYFIDIWELC